MSARRPPSRVIVIGTSAGGVYALLQLVKGLPSDLDAAVLIVLHVGANPSMLPELLQARCAWHVSHVVDGDAPAAGSIHVAPPDHHLLLEPRRMRLTKGPKENHARPAIDPLFRSAALNWGPRVIGVILTGQMDDGAAGLQAVKECGGIAVVQDPKTAAEPSMPRAALAAVEPDVCVGLEDVAAALVDLVKQGEPVQPAPPASRQLWHEVRINEGRDIMEHLLAIGSPSGITCPECGGALFEVQASSPPRYRCHIGHAYSALSLSNQHGEATEQVLRSGVRALQEREMLLRRLALVSRGSGRLQDALVGERRADEAREQAQSLRKIIEGRHGATGA
jgi:two-component system chemotaxis response regulator CheB